MQSVGRFHAQARIGQLVTLAVGFVKVENRAQRLHQFCALFAKLHDVKSILKARKLRSAVGIHCGVHKILSDIRYSLPARTHRLAFSFFKRADGFG